MDSIGLKNTGFGRNSAVNAVIVDSKMETVYMMDDGKVDRESLEDFIYR